MQTKRERKKQSNLYQLQIASNNGWVEYNAIADTIQFRMKGKPAIDFVLSESIYIDRDTNKTYRSNMKKFLKWYRRRRA